MSDGNMSDEALVDVIIHVAVSIRTRQMKGDDFKKAADRLVGANLWERACELVFYRPDLWEGRSADVTRVLGIPAH